ncbi:hypothetical protein S245_008521, partial [Arachis hypogaea]
GCTLCLNVIGVRLLFSRTGKRFCAYFLMAYVIPSHNTRCRRETQNSRAPFIDSSWPSLLGHKLAPSVLLGDNPGALGMGGCGGKT